MLDEEENLSDSPVDEKGLNPEDVEGLNAFKD